MMENSTERIYEQARDVLRQDEAAPVVTVVESYGSDPRGAGAKMLVFSDRRAVGIVGGGPCKAWVIDRAMAALSGGRSLLLRRPASDDDQDVCGEGLTFFIDVVSPRPTLLILAAGHIGQAVSALRAWLGYRVVVLDEHESIVSAERFPDADLLLSGPLDEKLQSLPLSVRVYLVMVTPHHSPDENALAALSRAQAGYAGLLGGRRRTKATFERARALGVSDGFLRQVHTPIGLDIQVETAREIALSVLAQGPRRAEGDLDRWKRPSLTLRRGGALL